MLPTPGKKRRRPRTRPAPAQLRYAPEEALLWPAGLHLSSLLLPDWLFPAAAPPPSVLDVLLPWQRSDTPGSERRRRGNAPMDTAPVQQGGGRAGSLKCWRLQVGEELLITGWRAGHQLPAPSWQTSASPHSCPREEILRGPRLRITALKAYLIVLQAFTPALKTPRRVSARLNAPSTVGSAGARQTVLQRRLEETEMSPLLKG